MLRGRRDRRLVLGILGCLAPAAGFAQGSVAAPDVSVSGMTVVAKAPNGRVLWRYTGGGAVLAAPVLLDSGRVAVRIASRRSGFSSVQVLSRAGTLIGGAAVSMGRSAPVRTRDGGLVVAGTRTGLDDLGTVEMLDARGRLLWVYEHARAVTEVSINSEGRIRALDRDSSTLLLSDDGVLQRDGVGPTTITAAPPLLTLPADIDAAAQLPLPFGLQKRFDLQTQQIRLRLGNQEVGGITSRRVAVLYADSSAVRRWMVLAVEGGTPSRVRLQLVVLGERSLSASFEMTIDVAKHFARGPVPLLRLVRRFDGGFGFDLGDRRFTYDADVDKLLSEPLS